MARRQSLIIPREHGAWGILLIPLFTGAAAGLLAGGSAARVAPLTIAVLALFWLRTPVESWLGTAPVKARTSDEFALVRRVAWLLAGASTMALARLFWDWRNWGLLWIGVAAGAAFGIQAIVKKSGRDRHETAQIIGAAGLTAVAPAAWCVVTGHFGAMAWMLWIANLLFAINQIQFVQLRIRAAHAATPAEKWTAGRGFLIGQVVLLALVLFAVAVKMLPWLAATAFLPILWRGFAWFTAGSAPLAIHALGKRELAYAGLFAAILVLGFVR